MGLSTVIGANGVRLSVRSEGPVGAPPIVFVHGWSQSQLSWIRQFESSLTDQFRLVAFDLRGHGASECPTGEDAYNQGDIWADDLAAVIEQCQLDRPVIVGWSFGGVVVGDYLRRHGDSAISAVNFVDTSVVDDDSIIGPAIFEYAEGAASDELEENIRAIRGFVRACTYQELDSDDVELMVAYNMIVQPSVRRAIAASTDFAEVYAELAVPVLVSHGLHDAVVLPIAVDRFRACIPHARISTYDNAGHAPFLEDPQRFNNELADLAMESAQSRLSGVE